jgi:hypothetical protein
VATISSRAWRWELNGKRSWPRVLIDALFFFDPDHCRESFESERTGRQLPPEMRVWGIKQDENTGNPGSHRTNTLRKQD